MKKFRDSVIRALLPYIILAEASKGPVHGYGVIAYIRKVYGVYFGPSTVYPLLKAMEKDGLIRSEWHFAGFNRPRKVYAITALGRRFLGQSSACLGLIAKPLIVNG